MKNEPKKINQINLLKPNGQKKSNDSDDTSLLAVGEKIKNASYNVLPTSEEFKEGLKSKILLKRQEGKTMKLPIFSWEWFLRPQRFVPAVAVVLIVAIVFGLTYFWPTGDKNPFGEFSKLIISPAYAQDNFELLPTKVDSLGIDSDTIFILKSQEELDAKAVRDNLVLSPDIEYDFKEISKQEWQIIPRSPLSPNAIIKLAVTSSYVDQADGQQKERDYSWAYQIKDNFKVLNSIPRDQSSGVPTNSGIEITFSHDNFIDIENYFSIEPKVEGHFEKHGRTLVFVPKNNLDESKIYTVTVKKGLTLAGSSDVLANDYTFVFETYRAPNNQPWLWFAVAEDVEEFSSQEKPVIKIYANNVLSREVGIKVYRFSDWQKYLESLKIRDALPWWASARRDYLEDTTNLTQVTTFSQTFKQDNYSTYVEFPEKLEPGFYLVELVLSNMKRQAWIQVTDLAAYLNIAQNKTVVWVNDLKSQSPASGAQVQILDTAMSGTTNSQGLAVFNTTDEYLKIISTTKDFIGQYLKVSQGDSVLILPASNYYTRNPQNSVDKYWSYLYTDRPLYQPKDTIKFWGILKDRKSGSLNQEIKVVLYKEGYFDYYYRPVYITENAVSLAELGTFIGEIKLDNLRPDYYTLQLKVGDEIIANKYIQISPYIKPAYQLTLIPERKAAYAGEPVKLNVSASFFEGTPVPDLELIFETPQGNQTFKTDELGKAELTYTETYQDCKEDWSCWPKTSWLRIHPKQSELANIEASTYVTFYGPSVYLKDEVTYPSAGVAQLSLISKKIDLNKIEAGQYYWQAQSLGEEIAPFTRIEGELTKITYRKEETGTAYDFVNKLSYKTYNYVQVRQKVDSFSATTDGVGQYVYKKDIEPETSYQLKLKYFDGQGRNNSQSYYFYYYDGQSLKYYSSPGWNYYHLDVTGNFSVGDQVSAKYLKNDDLLPAGQNRYLYLQMQAGLQQQEVTSDPIYQFTFEQNDIPNINLVGVYFNGQTYVESYGYVSFDAQKNRFLNIDVKSDKQQYQPGEEVKLSVLVTDKDNQPVLSEVNLNLIDEAYYAVMEDIANPLTSIYAGMSSGQIYSGRSHYTPYAFGGAEKGCFLAGTMILMADGSRKPIENIKVGDQVSTYNNPIQRELVKGSVTETYQHTVDNYLVINERLKVTPQHLVYSNFHFKEAGSLKVGDWLLDSQGQKINVESIQVVKKLVKVYNFRVDPQHTYFADSFYVHNEKGGGPREFFTDAALFQSLKTDQNGRGEVSFKLPDNVTSWRVTAQAISDNLYVGTQVSKIPVSLPVFADVTIASEYLKADKPIAKLRAFGAALTRSDDSVFTIQAESLGLKLSSEIRAKAFAAAYFPLPELKLGQHQVIYNLTTIQGKDAIKLPLNVVESRWVKQSARNEKLSTETKITAEGDEPVVVVLSDQGQNQLYLPLVYLAWEWGDRVDQRLTQKIARDLLSKYYQEESPALEFSSHLYQLSDGGITLLPYSSADIKLSARLAALATAEFDQESLAQYFFRKLEDKQSNREEITYALVGLAELKQPVLPRLQIWLETQQSLPVKDKLYLALALHDLGQSELARKIYFEILDAYGKKKDPYVIIQPSEDAEEVFKTTAAGMVLSSALNTAESDGLWRYLEQEQHLVGSNKNSEQLFNLEKINYISRALENLKPSPAKVAYSLGGQKFEVSLIGNTHAIYLEPQEVSNLKFLSLEGDVGVSMRQTKPVNLVEITPDQSVSIKRQYYVEGKLTNTFKDGDLVEIRLYPEFGRLSTPGSYQITDFLPSGLVSVSGIYYPGYGYGYDCHYWYPFSIDGQLIKFSIDRDWKQYFCGGNYFHYFARVKTRGDYVAEPTIIQSFINPNVINYASQEIIKISE